jgi:Uma2 family endonuclease
MLVSTTRREQTVTTQMHVREAIKVAPGLGDWPVQGRWRYEDYLRLPDDGRRYEIIEGMLYMANAPSVDHQFVVSELLFRLKLFVQERNLGQLYTAPIEVHLSETSRPVQPDLLFLSKEHLPKPGARFIAGAPDLVVEVISPNSIRLDRIIKFDVYERAWVSEYWLVDPKLRAVEVYTLASGEYALFGQYINGDVIESSILVGLHIQASAIFPTLT